MELPDLLTQADLIRDLLDHPAWEFIAGQVENHRELMLARLLNETTKPEEIPRLRGLVAGLACIREAPESILSFAAEAEQKAKQRETTHA